MSSETAEIVFYSISAAAGGFWLIGLLFMRTTTRRCRTSRFGLDTADVADPFFSQDQDEGGFRLSGSVEVDDAPDVLIARATRYLTRGDSLLGPVRIEEKTDRRLVITSVGVASRNQRNTAGVCVVRTAVIEFQPIGGGRTRVSYEAGLRGVGALLWAGWGVVILGAATIMIGGWLIATLVLPSEDPSIRTQSIQMVQAVHFLWPPFLFGGLARLRRRAAGESLTAMIQNLQHLEDSSG